VIHIPVLHQVPPPPNRAGELRSSGDIHIGKLLNALINFALVAGAIYFAIVLPTQYMLKRFSPPTPPAPPRPSLPECLSDIPLAARRCAHCAQPVA